MTKPPWAACDLRLPVSWYELIEQGSGAEFPISGDETIRHRKQSEGALMTISSSTIEALRELQDTVWQANEEKGFHADRPIREDFVPGERGDRAFAKAVRDDQSNRLMLIVGEASEAHEELRSGHAVDETYYSTNDLSAFKKPEGVPSELADIVIRCFDKAGVERIDLAGMIAEKLVYNTTRPFKHGRKF